MNVQADLSVGHISPIVRKLICAFFLLVFFFCFFFINNFVKNWLI